jgi:hypothetical protein
LESSRSTDLNGGGFASYGSIEVEIFDETWHGAVKNYSLFFVEVISDSSDRGITNSGSLESSRSDSSNGGGFAPFGSIDVEIFDRT